MKKERAQFLQAHPFESMQAAAKTDDRKRVFSYAPAYALAASLLLFVGVGIFFSTQQQKPGMRTKGATAIEIFVKADGQNIEKRDSHIYHPGEYIQLVYSCGRADKFVLLSIDERGKISTYFPSDSDSSIALEKGQNIPLPNSILLDDYIGKELFVAVFSPQPLAVETVRKKLSNAYSAGSQLSSLALPAFPGAIVKTILITKESPRQ